jgi:hypothetical protein
MPLDLTGTDELTKLAVAHYWQTLDRQSVKQRSGEADRGGRAAVTGGKQMNGFCKLIERLLINNGLKDSHIYLQAKLELPGFFRPTKNWDMLVVHEGTLLAAMEFKSQRGPSFGNNFNNRTEEAVGTAHDLAVAYREGVFGAAHPRPWVGWVMLVEDCPKSTFPVRVAEPHFRVRPEFRGTSYIKRYELLLRKLVMEKLYDGAAFLTATATGGPQGDFSEPAADLSMRKFLAGLGGHVSAYVAGR